MPFKVTASFLSSISSILGSRASADISAGWELSGENSQRIALLQTSVSPVLALADKEDKKNKGNGEADSNVDNSNINNNALIPPTPTVDSKNETFSSDQISVYVVRSGDSISQIADMFDVSVNTILWANNMSKKSVIKEGDVIFILPVSGVEHTVKKGDTIKSIAKLYKADTEDILQYNGLDDNQKLSVGDKLIIPNAQKESENDRPVKNLPASIAKDNKYYETHPAKNLSGYFINPVPGYRKSQGIHDRNGVDFAISTGTPIRASASGRVTLARTGWNGGFGNLVIIKHPNGTETLYAHQSKIATTTGAQVSQGQVIGYVGSTGRSTGPHLHFEVHGARNPGVDGSWAK